MATVYLAEDHKHDRRVALKLLRPELSAVLGTDRFLREIATTASLHHPQILPLFDSGTAASLVYYVMPYVDGDSLRARLRREPRLPIEEAVRIAAEVADALDYAHRQGVIHRDIKPENIILQEGRPLVADFGIALAMRHVGAERLTETGLSLGTPQYMSPEQAMAERELDARSDVYSLGVVLYEMLAGEPPFRGSSAQAVLAHAIVRPPTPVSRLRRSVPSALEAALSRALAKQPEERFPTAAAFAAALRGALASPPVYRPGRRAAAWAGGVLLVGLVAWLALVYGGHPSRARPTDPQVTDLYQRAMRSYSRRTASGALEAIRGFQAALARDSAFAPAWTGLAMTYWRVYLRHLSLPGIPRDSAIKLGVIAADRALAADSGSAEAWMAQAVVSRIVDPTDVMPALRSLRRALALDSTSGPVWHQYALTLAELGDYPGALAAWRRCTAVAPAYSEGLAFRGLADYWRHAFDSAQRWADSAVTVDPNSLLARSVAGQVAVELGDWSHARAAFDAAVRLGDDIDQLEVLAGSAMTEARAGRRQDAARLMRRVDSLARAYTPAPLHTAVYLAETYAAMGDRVRALGWLERYRPREDLHFQLHLRCDPPLEPVADEPRFAALLLGGRPRTAERCEAIGRGSVPQ